MNIINNINKNFTRASNVVIPEIYNRRFKTGKEDLDNIFGGSGFMPNLTFTLAAAPGTGKTSMLLQVLELLENTGKSTAYISGEENVEQLAFAAKRLNVQSVPLANMTDIDDICTAIVENHFNFVVLDSLPAITSRIKMNKKQLNEYITNRLIQTAKEHEIVIGVILHFTKAGTYKGDTLLPHSVDMNIIMTRNNDDYNLRDIDVTKNRFGSAGQAIFEMTSQGFTFESVEGENNSNKNNKKTSKYELVKNLFEFNAELTVTEICEKSGVTGAYLTTILRDLVNQGSLNKKGTGSSTTYSTKLVE